MAVFGSSSTAVDAAVAGVCGALHVPYISTLTKTEDGSAGVGGGGIGGGLVARFGPTSRHVSMAVRDLVGDLAWRDVALVVHRQSGNRSPLPNVLTRVPLLSHSFAAGRKSQVRIAPLFLGRSE